MKRSGFTLIELLVAISIIVVLIALLLPAVNSIRNNLRITEVRQEISQMESAIADFKLKFGNNPPSQVTLYESYGGPADSFAGWTDDSNSRAKIRKLWPRFDFGRTDPATGRTDPNSTRRDYNNDGDYEDNFILKGDQCLVFFLGGVYDPSKGTAVGFAGDPTNPFKLSSSASTRIGPFFNFDVGRLIGNFGVSYPWSDNGGAPSGDSTPIFPVYIDSLDGQMRPYIYVTSYEGLGYYDGPQMDSDANTFSAIAESANGFRVYRTESGEPWKPNGYQIISPGWDGEYGEGGIYNPDAPTELPPSNPTMPRLNERDNITNFTRGMLVP